MTGLQCRMCKDDKIRELRVVLDKEQLAFLADLGDRVDSYPYIQTMPNIAIFQTDDLDAFDSDCDEAPSASAVFIANLFAYESDVLSEVNLSQRKQPALYCGHTLVKKHEPVSEETLDLAETTRLKMNEKQNDPIVKEKRVNRKSIDYGSLNELYKHFVPKKQLSIEQAFWLPISKIVSKQTPVQPKPVENDLPCQLPTTSMVKQNLLKAKRHLDNFEKVIKVRTKVTGQNEGT
ncbi:hypothetical protein Tco_0530528 [Tanacetum coccineum]